jgi:hypothetical protein
VCARDGTGGPRNPALNVARFNAGLSILSSKGVTMKRYLVLSVAGALLSTAMNLMVVNAQQRQGAVFIAGDKPVTEDQVRAKLQTDGWSDVQINRSGHYFQVTANKNGEAGKIVIDEQTGRVPANSDGDDDDD